MKKLRAKARVEAFTLIELFVVIAIVTIFVALLLPTGNFDGRARAKVSVCAFNLKKIGSSFITWSREHEGKLPMQVSLTNGGSTEFISSASAVVHFLTLTNSKLELVETGTKYFIRSGKDVTEQYSITNYGLKRDLLICPSDMSRRNSFFLKKSFSEVTDTNISYFVGLDASLKNTNSILAGDRHLQIGKESVKPGLLTIKPNQSLTWSTNLHRSFRKGNVLFADGHVDFTKQLPTSNLATNHLAVP